MKNKQEIDKKNHQFRSYINSILCFSNDCEEEKISSEIIKHKLFMEDRLGRNLGIEVALLDYIKNINKDIHVPAIFKSLDIFKIHHSLSNHNENIKYYDRSVLSQDIKIEIERAHRYGSHFSILMFDLTNQDNSDPSSISSQILQSLNKCIRLTDTIYSYEINRYVLLLPETGPDEAVNAAEKLQEKFKNSELDEDSQFPSINIGVAIFGLYKIDTDHKLLSAADTALRKANESGSEKIILFQGDGFLDISEEGFEIQRIMRKQGRQIFDGIPIHRGMAVGHVFIYNDLLSHELESYDISDDNLEIEFIRISTAIHNVEKDLVNMEHLVCDNLTEEYAAIFQAHRLILKDNQVLDEIKKNLYEKKVNGETIVREVFKKWEKRFLAFEDEVFKNKSHDIADISGRIIKELQGIDSQILESAPADSIILANRLLPSDTVNLNRKNIKAIVTKEGSRFSHMAILSKAMNIPLVIVEDLDLSQFGQDDTILVDGEKGSVIINPSEDELSQAKETIGNYDREHISTNSSDLKDFFYKGEPVYIHAAASNRDETEEAVSYGVQGIGLFRMEVFYLSQNELPDEETLKREIERILEPCKSKEIVIRLLDIGGDKNLSYLDITERYNSSLGLRGVRLFKKFPHLLETQLRAIIKLSQNYSVKILIPMVTLVDDITFVRQMYEKIKNGLKIKEEIPIGAMIETPAAVLAIDPILECCDFVSIGSNDLIQYTVAADREKLSVSQYYEEGGKIVQEFIKIINEKALKSHKKCYLCGELAQNRIFTRDLMEIGCRNFTITSSILPAFKKTIKALSDS